MTSKKSPTFTVVFEANGTEYVEKGDTVIEALRLISKFTPKTKGVLVASKGKLKSVQILRPHLIRRFMVNDIYRTLIAKRLEMTLK